MKKWVEHPCIYQENGKLSLKIFKFFYCEMNLPKYKEGFKFQNDGNLDAEEIMFARSDWESMQDAMAKSASSDWRNSRNNADYIINLRKSMNQKLPFLQKLYNWWNKIDPVETTFDKIKNSKGKISDDLKETMDNLNKIIQRAERSNQLALVEKIKEVKNVVACRI